MNNIEERELRRFTRRQLVMFSLFCCYQVEDDWKNVGEIATVITTVEKWLKGEAKKDECKDAANTSITIATYTTPEIIANAAECAADACYATYCTDPEVAASDAAWRVGHRESIYEAKMAIFKAQREWLERFSEAYIVKEVLKDPRDN